MKYANNRNERRTGNARAITRAKRGRQNAVIAAVSLSLVAVVAAGCLFVNALHTTQQNMIRPTTAIATTAEVSPAANNNAPQAAVMADQGAPVANQIAQAAGQEASAERIAAQSALTQCDSENIPVESTQPATQPAAQPTEEQQENSNIRIINGERIYIDTKRPVPEVTGNPDFYYANGETSYGFDWDYFADNLNFVLRCDYSFTRQQYQFGFYGTQPGTANITLYYFTADDVKVPVKMVATVDNDLNLTLSY